MSSIRFTQNHEDLSTERGYQFKFYCDRCGNGIMSSFQTSATGVAGGLLRAAGEVFGGFLGQAGNSAYEIQRAVGGKAHDSALQAAVEEVRPQFRQCKRCGKWVCPEVCFNTQRGLCMDCAPDLENELAAAQASAVKDQIWEKAAATDLIASVDMNTVAVAACPECGAKCQGSKFCPECGAKLNAKTKCKKCGAEPNAGTKFCPDCGNRLA
jgi:membrane protease subunit (stomatin/prohibitin family)